MIEVTGYWVVNGSKSDTKPIQRELNDKRELESLREEMLRKESCYKKTPLGEKKIADIMFRYIER